MKRNRIIVFAFHFKTDRCTKSWRQMGKGH